MRFGYTAARGVDLYATRDYAAGETLFVEAAVLAVPGSDEIAFIEELTTRLCESISAAYSGTKEGVDAEPKVEGREAKLPELSDDDLDRFLLLSDCTDPEDAYGDWTTLSDDELL